jgi:hypothetical protein
MVENYCNSKNSVFEEIFVIIIIIIIKNLDFGTLNGWNIIFNIFIIITRILHVIVKHTVMYMDT